MYSKETWHGSAHYGCNMDGKKIKFVPHLKLVGMTIGSRLNWKKTACSVASKGRSMVGAEQCIRCNHCSSKVTCRKCIGLLSDQRWSLVQWNIIYCCWAYSSRKAGSCYSCTKGCWKATWVHLSNSHRQERSCSFLPSVQAARWRVGGAFTKVCSGVWRFRSWGKESTAAQDWEQQKWGAETKAKSAQEFLTEQLQMELARASCFDI